MSFPAIGFFAALGIELPDHGATNRQVRCFSNAGAHATADRTPSCSVHAESGAWHCFACDARGGAYDAAITLGRTPSEAADLCKAHGLWRDDANTAPRTRATAVARTVPRSQPQRAPLPTEEAVEIWARDLQASPVRLGAARQHRAWTPGALAATGTGWDGKRFTIPVRDGSGALVNVVRYLPGGRPKSLALAGRPRDLFPAPERLRTEGPELFVGDGPEVFIVEGEGDAITAQSLPSRLYAIAVPGANGWRHEWAQRFAGMRVRVLCDHDDAGRRLSAKVADDVASHAAEVRVLDWATITGRSDLPSGFDLTDWALQSSRAVRERVA